MQHFDLIVVGGGPGGYVAAIRAAQLKKRVALIERARIGGTCLNHGCIPTKALYRTAEVLNEAVNPAAYGVHAENVSLDLTAARARKEKVVDTLVSGVQSLLKSNGVAILSGQASFIDAKTLRVGDEIYTADAFIIATGSKNAAPLIEGVGLDGVMDSAEALRLDEVPQNLVLIGGGVVGAELAGIYRAFGSEVTIVEFLPSILSMLDGELSKFAAKRLVEQGVRILSTTKVTRVEGTRGGLTVHTEGSAGPATFSCTHVICCAGRAPNTDGLNLEAAGVAFDRKGIKVDEDYRTTAAHIYAIGDVTGRMMLAHVASEEGRVCVEHMCGMKSLLGYALVPSCVTDSVTAKTFYDQFRSGGVDRS